MSNHKNGVCFFSLNNPTVTQSFFEFVVRFFKYYFLYLRTCGVLGATKTEIRLKSRAKLKSSVSHILRKISHHHEKGNGGLNHGCKILQSTWHNPVCANAKRWLSWTNHKAQIHLKVRWIVVPLRIIECVGRLLQTCCQNIAKKTQQK